ncbi:sensor domain-containing diguanylate cyclase [Parachitinimonas caeni]|uniref:diguanylate cyclase n=1 Tax=Parachitinimonas caeni TaxID=3031301 RepID=A0ABT7DY42_9NEIS|nr:diguanylate cyclase [Parachitinimonas caeni]MDK2124980.1 diguanylate cyclase [Parachitinimonas caeni]
MQTLYRSSATDNDTTGLSHQLVRFVSRARKPLAWAGLVVMVLAALIFHELRQNHADAQLKTMVDARNLAHLMAERFSGNLREIRLILDDIGDTLGPAELAEVSSMSSERHQVIEKLLAAKLEHYSRVDQLGLIGPDGRFILTSGAGPERSLKNHPIFRTLTENPGQSLAFGPAIDGTGLAVGLRLGEGHQFTGVAVANLGTEQLQKLLLGVELSDDDIVALVRDDLSLLASRPDHHELVGQPLPLKSQIAQWVNARSDDVIGGVGLLDERIRSYGFKRLEEAPFLVIVGVGEEAGLRAWRHKALAYVLGGMLSSLLLLAIIYRGWRETELVAAIARQQSRLQQQEQRFRFVVETMPTPLLMVRANGLVLYANRAVGELLGVALADIIDHPLFSYVSRNEQATELAAKLDKEHTLHDYEIRLKRGSGEVFWASLAATQVECEGEPAYLIALDDITQRKVEQETLWRKATLDPLTGVANRGYLLELAYGSISRAKRFNEPLGVLMLDLDYFKRVNDTWGHDAGDKVLMRFAAECSSTLRGFDLLGRIGGEEFAVILPNTPLDGALLVAERIRERIEALSVLVQDNQPVHVTVSIGLAMLASEDQTIEDTLRRADQALYAAKAAGRNRVMTDLAEAPPSR